MKIDLFRQHRDEYAMAREPKLVSVGSGRYLTITGKGSPEEEHFRTKIAALYGTAYALKFAAKARGRDFKVGILEGLWGAAGSPFGIDKPKTTWRWKLAIRVPTFVTATAVRAAQLALRAKRGPVPTVNLETMREGTSVQALHVGAYADEPATIAKMETFARAKGLRFRGRHHEIYLSDPKRVPPSRLRTILRHPVT